jgi:hypothetical protein
VAIIATTKVKSIETIAAASPKKQNRFPSNSVKKVGKFNMICKLSNAGRMHSEALCRTDSDQILKSFPKNEMQSKT